MLLIFILIINDNISGVRNDDIVIKLLLFFYYFCLLPCYLVCCMILHFRLFFFFIKRLKFILDKLYIAEIIITSIPTYYSYMSIKIFSSFYSFDFKTHHKLVYFHFNIAGVWDTKMTIAQPLIETFSKFQNKMFRKLWYIQPYIYML